MYLWSCSKLKLNMESLQNGLQDLVCPLCMLTETLHTHSCGDEKNTTARKCAQWSIFLHMLNCAARECAHLHFSNEYNGIGPLICSKTVYSVINICLGCWGRQVGTSESFSPRPVRAAQGTLRWHFHCIYNLRGLDNKERKSETAKAAQLSGITGFQHLLCNKSIPFTDKLKVFRCCSCTFDWFSLRGHQSTLN